MTEPLDLDRARLLLVWLQARRAVDHCLADLLAAGPAGERRVRARLDLVEELESAAGRAFAAYARSARSVDPANGPGPRPTDPRPTDARPTDARPSGRRLRSVDGLS